jgi:hypothetical protein
MRRDDHVDVEIPHLDYDEMQRLALATRDELQERLGPERLPGRFKLYSFSTDITDYPGEEPESYDPPDFTVKVPEKE